MSKMLRMTTQEYQARTVKRPKYGNKKKMVNGMEFDSTKEARRYQDLALMQEAGQIRSLRRQVPYGIYIKGQHICGWLADFVYEELIADIWRHRVEDTKGWKTDVYRLKKKLVEAEYGFKILET